MVGERVFLDTSVILSWIKKSSKEADRIINDPDITRFINGYVLKEVYWVLNHQQGFSEQQIRDAVEDISNLCTILPTPSKEEFMKIRIRDKSDRPMVCSALKYNLVLLIDDEKTYRDAKKYVKVKRISKNGD